MWPRILSESLAPLDPFGLLLRTTSEASPAAVARSAARALTGYARTDARLPDWLTPHQMPAARRLLAMIDRHGGALLADAPGLGKSYVALAVALARHEPFGLVVPSILVDQWRALLRQHGAAPTIMTHESLSGRGARALPDVTRFLVVDEAHRFRNPETNRYRALSKLVVGRRALLVTATPVHNNVGDLLHLLRLFVRDDALTALGVPSLGCAARDGASSLTVSAVARFTVARSRERVRSGYAGGQASHFPARTPNRVIIAGSLPAPVLDSLVQAVDALRSGVGAVPLLRLLLFTRLASSAAAFRESVTRYAAFLELTLDAARQGRALGARDFQRLFPERDADALQLALFPMLLEAGSSVARADDLTALDVLRDFPACPDPKAEALESLLSPGHPKTIVFAGARATVRYLARRLGHRRAAALLGDGGMFSGARASPAEVLRAFAPRSQGARDPAPALDTDLLIATDLLSEGLNLQDAARVIHYDVPWSPARLGQRVGRIDRLGSSHQTIDTVTFLPPEPLAGRLRLDERHASKVRAQMHARSAHIEGIRGHAASGLDWCDRLHRIASDAEAGAPVGAVAVMPGSPAVVLVVQLGELVEAILVDDRGARPDPEAAAGHFERAVTAAGLRIDPTRVAWALEQATPLVRGRLSALASARWRAVDRDRPGRRLIPAALAFARAAARRGDAGALARMDALISRLGAGMTAGEEQYLTELLVRPSPLSVDDLLDWHEVLPPPNEGSAAPQARLIAVLVLAGDD